MELCWVTTSVQAFSNKHWNSYEMGGLYLPATWEMHLSFLNLIAHENGKNMITMRELVDQEPATN